MAFFSHPRAFRFLNSDYPSQHSTLSFNNSIGGMIPPLKSTDANASAAHPSIGHLTLLVFEAVLEVVCVSLPGYIIARRGFFDADMQKFVANLNVMLFTPCLIFTKLASQLTADTLVDLAIIPVIFILQILISYLCSIGISRSFRFAKRPQNFVIAMGVFGNSNSLPISLVISLSKTISGLHWDKIKDDNDDEVAARGILYLLIFQQLGQLLRWSWGYHVLLAPPRSIEGEAEASNRNTEPGEDRYFDDPLPGVEESVDPFMEEDQTRKRDTERGFSADNLTGMDTTAGDFNEPSNLGSGNRTATLTPNLSSELLSETVTSPRSTISAENVQVRKTMQAKRSMTKSNGHSIGSNGDIVEDSESEFEPKKSSFNFFAQQLRQMLNTTVTFLIRESKRIGTHIFSKFPERLQRGAKKIGASLKRFSWGLWEFMNPPLWAMLAAILVASIPALQKAFFTKGSFIQNSVTRAISQSGGVAVPLILVVLGANLARNTLPADSQRPVAQDNEERNLIIASLISRMLLPTVIMAPILALGAKYVPVSILDDPIFVVVCFLLTGAPSALQLAQICQINGVYEGAMARLLFQSYVVWILPSTLILVLSALEVVQWAG